MLFVALELLVAAPAEALELPDAPSFATSRETITTASGLRVVLAPEPGAAQVTAQWLFDAGANDDDAAHAGLAHLVEHLAFGPLGGVDLPDYDARLGALGGSSDGWTDRERSGLGAMVPTVVPGAAAALVQLEADRWERLVIDAQGIEKQRRIVHQELAETLDLAHGPDRAWLDTLLWAGGEPWSRHPQSPPSEAATVEEAKAKWGHMRARAVLVFAGGFEIEPVRAAVMAAFAGEPVLAALPRGPGGGLGEPGCEPGAPAVRWRKGDVAEGALYVAWPVPGRGSGDRLALEAIARWMGGARVSVGEGCGELVVERRGGWWRIGEHAASIRRAVTGLGRQGIDAATLRRLQTAQLTDLARANGLLDLRARILGACALTPTIPGCLDREAEGWLALTVEDTRRAAARWLFPEASTTLAVMPPDTEFGPPIPGMRRWGGP
ncbi:hypothetical protein LBMAG42_40950 [Deltaproteobacteria bacterium]|nr:hypothetical protein LBMAG42_40950 [Deltaproteobacteria bacterium]